MLMLLSLVHSFLIQELRCFIPLCTELSVCINRRKLAKQRKKEKSTTSVESPSTKEKNKKHKDNDKPVPSAVSGSHSDDERG